VAKDSLLEKSFQSLPVVGIFTKQVVFALPSDLSGLDNTIAILDEIYYNCQDDLEKSQHLLQSPPPPPDMGEFSRFQRREIWRIGSFIVFALNLERTLVRRYKELLDFVEKLDPDADVVTLSNALLQRRKEEVKEYKYHRDKVFAHTAYGSPRDEDNLSMQATSLAYLEAIMGGITPDGIRFGAASVVVGGQDPPQFKSFTFPEMVADFSRHFLEWREMFSDLCDILQGSTDDEIKQHIEGVVRITRS
jgi:hypothetical protein